MTTLSDDAAIARPLIDVRDVLEGFRRYDLRPTTWSTDLSSAADALDQAATNSRFKEQAERIAAELRKLIEVGLQNDRSLTDRIASETAQVLDQSTIPGIPKPQDEDWGF